MASLAGGGVPGGFRRWRRRRSGRRPYRRPWRSGRASTRPRRALLRIVPVRRPPRWRWRRAPPPPPPTTRLAASVPPRRGRRGRGWRRCRPSWRRRRQIWQRRGRAARVLEDELHGCWSTPAAASTRHPHGKALASLSARRARVTSRDALIASSVLYQCALPWLRSATAGGPVPDLGGQPAVLEC